MVFNTAFNFLSLKSSIEEILTNLKSLKYFEIIADNC